MAVAVLRRRDPCLTDRPWYREEAQPWSQRLHWAQRLALQLPRMAGQELKAQMRGASRWRRIR